MVGMKNSKLSIVLTGSPALVGVMRLVVPGFLALHLHPRLSGQLDQVVEITVLDPGDEFLPFGGSV
jgi:hypothetical protein